MNFQRLSSKRGTAFFRLCRRLAALQSDSGNVDPQNPTVIQVRKVSLARLSIPKKDKAGQSQKDVSEGMFGAQKKERTRRGSLNSVRTVIFQRRSCVVRSFCFCIRRYKAMPVRARWSRGSAWITDRNRPATGFEWSEYSQSIHKAVAICSSSCLEQSNRDDYCRWKRKERQKTPEIWTGHYDQKQPRHRKETSALPKLELSLILKLEKREIKAPKSR